jgi:hypothetical protein
VLTPAAGDTSLLFYAPDGDITFVASEDTLTLRAGGDEALPGGQVRVKQENVLVTARDRMAFAVRFRYESLFVLQLISIDFTCFQSYTNPFLTVFFSFSNFYFA